MLAKAPSRNLLFVSLHSVVRSSIASMSSDHVSSPAFVAKAKEYQTYFPVDSPMSPVDSPLAGRVGDGVSAFDPVPRMFNPRVIYPLIAPLQVPMPVEKIVKRPPSIRTDFEFEIEAFAVVPAIGSVIVPALVPAAQLPAIMPAAPLPVIVPVAAPAPRVERKRKAPADNEPDFPSLDKACGELPDNVIHFEITAVKRLPVDCPLGFFMYHVVGAGFNVSSSGRREAEYDFDVYVTEFELIARVGNDNRLVLAALPPVLATGPQGVAGLKYAHFEIFRTWNRLADQVPAFQLAAGAVARCTVCFDGDDYGTWKKITCEDHEYGELSPGFTYELELLHWPEARRRVADGVVLRRSARLSGLPAAVPAAILEMPAAAPEAAPEMFYDVCAGI